MEEEKKQIISHFVFYFWPQISNEVQIFPLMKSRNDEQNTDDCKVLSLTFRDEEAGSVEAGSDSRDGVDHARLIDPLKRTFFWMPLHSVKRVPIG